MRRSRSLHRVLSIAPLSIGLGSSLFLSCGPCIAAEPSSTSSSASAAAAAAEGSGSSAAAAAAPQGNPEPSVAPPTVSTPAPTPAPTATLAVVREVVLDLSDRRISLVDNGTVMGSWPVAIGDPSTPTPTGRFSVQTKVLNPQYQSTKSGKVNPTLGPDSPLGDRWIGFHQSGPNQYGIHGTPNAWSWTVSSRAAVTHGCVRMLRDHVRKLFDLVEVGTPVVVKP